MDNHYDVVIAGGGLVGSSLAIALDDAGLRVALVEAAPPRVDAQPSYDERNLALARASLDALGALGVGDRIAATVNPIRRIHVSRAGEFGSVRLRCEDHAVDAFGGVLPARELGSALLAGLDACRTLERFAPAQLVAREEHEGALTVRWRDADGERAVATRLLVGADGTSSFVRDACAIGADRHDYAQHLIVTTVTAAKSLDQCAYERFSDEGPVAMLPLGDRRAGLVLSVDAGSAADAAALDDDGFLALAQRRFGWRLGRLTRPGRRVAYPIHRVVARALIAPRTVLVGNAAQTIHPIGAQGFNLGLRDALTLAELVIEAARAGGDVGAASLLQTHAQRRRADRDGTLAFSDGLVRVACSPALPLRPLRSLGMLLLDGVSPLKDALVRRGMGLRGRPTPYAFGERP